MTIEELARSLFDRRYGAGAYDREKAGRIACGLQPPWPSMDDYFEDARALLPLISAELAGVADRQANTWPHDSLARLACEQTKRAIEAHARKMGKA